MSFEKNIFINCPFDAKYKRLLHTIIFSCQYCDLNIKIAKLQDSGSVRINQIIQLIKESKYSVHDLSRMKSKQSGELARFNMPFELGLDLGIRETLVIPIKQKKCIIIDSDKYRYQAALSDLSGCDISSYGKRNQIENLIENLRNWFTITINPVQPASLTIIEDYAKFQLFFINGGFDTLSKNIKMDKLTTSEFIYYSLQWIKENK